MVNNQQGKIVASPISNFVVGMQVYYPMHNEWYYVLSINVEGITVSKYKTGGLRLVFKKDQLKTLVVDKYDSDSENVLIRYDLLYSDWDFAVISGIINTDKPVEFKSVDGLATITTLPPEPRMYTEEEVIELCRMAFDRVIVLPHDSTSFQNWKKHYFK